MTHRKGAIWTERVLLGLILVSVAATLNLLLLVYRLAPSDQKTTGVDASPQPVVEVTVPAATPSPAMDQVVADRSLVAVEPESQPPPPPAEDPTQKAVGALSVATAKETEAARATDQRTIAMEAGLKAAAAESARWKRRELLVRQQVAGIAAQADRLEREADALEAERDVLEHERDATKAALAQAGKRSGFAVLPYKGPNGTWRRPIVIECTGGGAKLQPSGPRFATLELSPRIHPRSSSFVKAIARELLHIRSAETPDGTPAVPYIVFLVRPDGIGAYYLARTCLEPLGIAFGYELVEQKLAVNIPDFDDLTTWDGSMPLDVPLEPAPARLARGDQNATQPGSPPTGTPSPSMGEGRVGVTSTPSPSMGEGRVGVTSTLPGGDLALGRSLDGSSQGIGQGGRMTSGSGGSAPDDFVWPGRGRPALRDGGRSPTPAAAGEWGNQNTGGGANSQGTPDGPGLGGIPEKTGGTGTATGAYPGSGRASAAGAAGQGFADHPGGSGSGMAASPVNREDIGTGNSTEPGASPLSTGSPGAGGLADGQHGLGGGSAGSGGLFQLPNFEPASDQAGASSTSAGTLAPSGGSLSPRASGSGVAGTLRVPSANPLPGASGSDVAGTLRVPSANPNSDASGSDVAGTLRVPSANPNSDVSGSDVAGTPGVPSANPLPDASGSGIAGTPGVPSANRVRAFDWNQAAQDGPQSGSMGAQGLDPALGAQSPGPVADPVAPGNPPPAGMQNQSNGQATGRTGLQPGAYQGGQYSQDDANRAQALSGLSSLVSPSLAEKLAGAMSSTSSGSGTPSSSTPDPSQSNSQSAGMPLGGASQPSSSTSSSSSLAFGPNFSTSSDPASELKLPPRPKETPPMGSIEVRFEIVVVCRKDGVVLHPGSYRLTSDLLRSPGQGQDSLLAREIRAMVRNRAIVDPMIRQKPTLRFLVESQGADTFSIARRQLLFSLPDWPVALQVAGSQDPGIFSRKPW